MSFFQKPPCLEKNYIISPIRKRQYIKPKKKPSRKKNSQKLLYLDNNSIFSFDSKTN